MAALAARTCPYCQAPYQPWRVDQTNCGAKACFLRHKLANQQAARSRNPQAPKCPTCRRKLRDGKTCSKCTPAPPLTFSDWRLYLGTFDYRDPYPLETTTTIPQERILAIEEVQYRRLERQGLERTSCPDCGGTAHREPPLWVNGQPGPEVIRCRKCDAIRRAAKLCSRCGLCAARAKSRLYHKAPTLCQDCYQSPTEAQTSAPRKARGLLPE